MNNIHEESIKDHCKKTNSSTGFETDWSYETYCIDQALLNRVLELQKINDRLDATINKLLKENVELLKDDEDDKDET